MPKKKALRQIEDNTILYFGWPRKWQRRSHCTELVASNHLNSAQTKAKSLAKKNLETDWRGRKQFPTMTATKWWTLFLRPVIKWGSSFTLCALLY